MGNSNDLKVSRIQLKLALQALDLSLLSIYDWMEWHGIRATPYYAPASGVPTLRGSTKWHAAGS